jgi:hypothetical protein
VQDETTNSPPVETSTPVESTPVAETPSSVEKSTESSSEPTKETLLDVVQSVVKPTEEPKVETEKASVPEPTETPPEDEENAEDEESSTEPETAAAEEEVVQESLPTPVKRKLRKLQKESLKLRNEIENLRTPAEIGQQLVNFQQANDLATDDIMMALNLATMVRQGDYQQFYKVIAPLVRHAQEVTGVVLPPDLQAMVDQQQITPQAAREFANTRFEKTNYEARHRAMEMRQAENQLYQVQGDVQKSVAALEQRIAAQDPDYKAKADAVRRTAQAMLFERGGKINSVDEALQITQTAYNEVNNHYRRLQQPVRATTPTPNSSNAQTPSVRTAPKSIMEAALMGLEKSRRMG